jgi:hypothetical protein
MGEKKKVKTFKTKQSERRRKKKSNHKPKYSLLALKTPSPEEIKFKRNIF